MNEEKKLSRAVERQAQKEAEAAKQAEIEAAAAAQKLEEEKETFRHKLLSRRMKELQRDADKAVRAITDKVKGINELEKEAISRNEQSALDHLKIIREEYERALKALKAERDRAEKEIYRTRDNANSSIRETNKPKYAALEAEMAQVAEDRAGKLQGFKEKLESATLEDLREMWGEKQHEPPGLAEARA